ncbi:M3 family metallopeptidase [Nakamurella sp. A5-74]|uniref:M3 family metallopeptidase n=1 Tax=Nakamurella sp. A5-74 TaxID=3158264 RepID=A0AAU8DLW7_9ACTN
MSAPPAPTPPLPADNPFARPSDLPFGLPRFADIELEHYLPAWEHFAAEHLAEIAAIVADPAVPDFENTLVALERSGQGLNRVALVFFNLVGSMATADMQQLEAELSPRLAAHFDEIKLNPDLFQRIDAVHRGRFDLALDAQQIALVERHHADFVLAGARLDAQGRDELKSLNQQVATLGSIFQRQLLADTEASALLLTGAEMVGVGADAMAATAAAAEKRGEQGHLVALGLPSQQPLLASLGDRDVRARLYEASVNRASAGETDNAPIAQQIAVLRARSAQLLGFDTYADLVASDQTARTSAAVDAMLSRMVRPAAARRAAEAELLQEFASRDGIDLEPWDWSYYASQVEAERFQVDTAQLKPYFELERVLVDGVFHAAERLYGITFRPRPDLVGYHPEVRVWEVVDHPASGEETILGLYLGDFFARDIKRGGAWMTNFVEQSHLLGTKPVILNVLNVAQAPEGTPTLLTLDEVRTFFHEFGHCLHGLFSDVTYPRLSGTSVPRDFVEFPSQVNEMWALEPEIVRNYARHVETGEVLPQLMLDALHRASVWGQGQGTSEMLGATLLDQAWHRIQSDEDIDDPIDFEEQSLVAAGIADELVPPRYRTTYFQHIFAGLGGYAAGYYSYLWSEVLDADTVEWFRSNGGLTRENGDTFRRKLLAVGSTRDPMTSFADVVGREPDITPLLRRRGLLDDADGDEGA